MKPRHVGGQVGLLVGLVLVALVTWLIHPGPGQMPFYGLIGWWVMFFAFTVTGWLLGAGTAERVYARRKLIKDENQ